VMTLALLLFGGCAAVLPQLLAEQFPVNIRSIGVGLPYSVTVALFGGTAPFVVEGLAARNMQAWFPWYVSALCLVSLVTLVRGGVRATV
jgi:MHS family alpha-ketoglutarate permease-like MFS transporter